MKKQEEIKYLQKLKQDLFNQIDMDVCIYPYRKAKNSINFYIEQKITKLEKEVIMTSMNVLIEGTELSFNQEAHGSDLEIAKNILPKDKIELHILDDYCAIWLKEGETFDKEKQLLKGVEEFSEMIVEISRILSGRNEPISKEFISEVADCQIMLNQFKSQLPIHKAVVDEMEVKIKRLNQRIKEGKLEK